MSPAVSDEEEEKLDVEDEVEALNKALALEYRSALQYSLTSSSLLGTPAQAISARLIGFGDLELADARTLIEKIVSLGGEPTTDVAGLRHPDSLEAGLDWLIESETEAIEALQRAIAPTGRDGRSEAIEHMLEHMVMRKQRQVDLLIRARG